MDEFKELVETYKDIKENDLGKEKKSMLIEMSLANGGDHCKFFPYPRYRVHVYTSGEHLEDGIPHFHVKDVQEDWELKFSMRGDLLKIVSYGKRRGEDQFADIVKKIKEWLPLRSKKYPEITNFVRVQRLWNDNNEEKGFGIDVEENW